MLARVACGAGERDRLARRARSCKIFVEFRSPAGEALFVFRFAAEAGDGQIIGFGVAERRPAPTGAGQRKIRTLQITPHFLRSSHSPARRPSSSRNTIGMSHKSRVSRTVMPASE